MGEITVRTEDLNPVIVAIGNIERTIRGDGDIAGVVELTTGLTFTTSGFYKLIGRLFD